MRELDMDTLNGHLNIECRTDGGIGIYIETKEITLMMNKEQMLKLAGWLITYIEEKK